MYKQCNYSDKNCISGNLKQEALKGKKKKKNQIYKTKKKLRDEKQRKKKKRQNWYFDCTKKGTIERRGEKARSYFEFKITFYIIKQNGIL